MPLYDALTVLCWVIFLGYWIVASVGVKRDRGEKDAWKSSVFALRITLLFLLVVLTFAGWPFVEQIFSLQPIIYHDSVLAALGVVLCAAGLALGIWARVHLGRNWSDEPALKEGHALVVSGPYYFIRHPIYTGVLTAIIGSALEGGAVWLVVLFVVSIIFAYRMQKEERLLTAEFPAEYSAYKKRTTALVPFVL